MNNMRVRKKPDAFVAQRHKDGLDIGHLEIESATALSRLIRRQDPHQQSHRAGLEKRHLRRRGKKERQSEDVAVKGGAAFEVLNGDHDLGQGGVR